MKKVYILLLTLATLSSCSNDDDNSQTSEIVAQWKLVEAKLSGFEGGNSSNGSIDYSNQNIIYNFTANGTLIVTGEEHIGYSNGEYQYFFGEDHLGTSSDPQILLVKINQLKWTYDFTNERMTLGQSYVDGSDLVFEKL